MKPTPKFRLWREQNVILATTNGSWNRFTAEDYAAEFKALAQPLTAAPWAHIVYLDNWQLGVPEIEPVWQMQIDYRLIAASGEPFEGEIQNTIHRLAPR